MSFCGAPRKGLPDVAAYVETLLQAWGFYNRYFGWSSVLKAKER